MINKLLQLKNECWTALKYVIRDDISYKIMALSFTTLLSIVPLLALILYFLTLYFEYYHLSFLNSDYWTNNFLPHADTLIVNYLHTFSERAFRLSIFNILFFFISAIWLVITIENVMFNIWEESFVNFNFFSLLIYTFIILIIPFLILVISLLSYILTFAISHIFTWKILLNIVPLILNTLIFIMLYTMTAKDHSLKLSESFFGGFIAAFLLQLSKTMFTLYIKYLSYYEVIYGTLSILPVFALWIYIFWFITLYGAVIVKVRHVAGRKGHLKKSC